MFEVFGGGGFVFALRVLPVIVFFFVADRRALLPRHHAICYPHSRRALRAVLKTSRTESLSATANIFVGQTEAPLVVRPYIATMTRSELFAVMWGGLAPVAGSVLAGYAQMGVPLEYLIAASFMAAPGGLLFAKIIVPETEQPGTTRRWIKMTPIRRRRRTVGCRCIWRGFRDAAGAERRGDASWRLSR